MGADSPLGGRTILLDPGHGGDDNYQAGRTGLVEADYVDRVAECLQTLLERAGARVVRTRRGNATVSVEERIALARRAEPELTISLHLGRFRARSGVAACFSWRHGLSGWRFARRLARRLSAATGLPVAGVRWRRGTAGAGYELIYACRTPAVVLELGQLGSQPDEVVLAVSDSPQRLAAAIFHGVLEQCGADAQSWANWERLLSALPVADAQSAAAAPSAEVTLPTSEAAPARTMPPTDQTVPAGQPSSGEEQEEQIEATPPVVLGPAPASEQGPGDAEAGEGGGGDNSAGTAGATTVGLLAEAPTEPQGSGSQLKQTHALPLVAPLRTVGISPLASALQSGLMTMPPGVPAEGVESVGEVRPLAASGPAGGSLSAEEVAQMYRSIKQVPLKPPAAGQTLPPIQRAMPQPSIGPGSQQQPVYQPGRPAQQPAAAQPPRRKT